MRNTIQDIARIERDKAGNIINLSVIHLTNGKSIFRSLVQMKTDLEGSGRLIGVNLESIQNVNHPAFVEACTKLAGGEVNGDYRFVKEGDEFIVTDVMRRVTDPNHPEYGKWAVGDTAKYKTDNTLVDGFLTLTPSYKQLQVEENAKQSAMFQAQLLGMFDTAGAPATSDAPISADDLPEDVVQEVLQATDAEDVAKAVEKQEEATTEK